jgi:hypothetical protein
MNRQLLSTVVSWRTRNKKKMARMEAWCADYGLKSIHKALHIGALSERERRTLERKFSALLIGKLDTYCILVLCRSCATGLGKKYEFVENTKPYELV